MCREAIDAIIELEHWGLPFNRTADGQDRPAAVRRPHPQPRRGAGSPGLLRRRPHRPHDPADAVPAVHQAGTSGSSTSSTCSTCCMPRRRPGRGGGRLRAGHRRAPRVPGQGGAVRHRRLRQDVQGHLQRPRPHRRRPGVCYRRGIPLEDMEFFQFHPTGIYRLGILLSEAVRGEGGILRQRRGRAVHGALRPHHQGPRPPGHGEPGDLPGDQGGPRRRRQGLRLPRRPPPRPGDPYARSQASFVDEVARSGVAFERAYAAAPITLPSHATLMTGRYPPGHGSRDNGLRVLANGPDPRHRAARARLQDRRPSSPRFRSTTSSASTAASTCTATASRADPTAGRRTNAPRRRWSTTPSRGFGTSEPAPDRPQPHLPQPPAPPAILPLGPRLRAARALRRSIRSPAGLERYDEEIATSPESRG